MNCMNIVDSLRNLHDLSKAINSTLKVNEVLEIILKTTSKLMQSQKVIILLLDNALNSLTVYSSKGLEENEIPVKVFNDVKSFDHCIVHKGTVIRFNELFSKSKYIQYVSLVPALNDMFFAPLEIKGEAYGLLGVTGQHDKVSLVELEIFCALGSQAAVAIENANLYQKLHNTFLRTAEALAEAVNSRDPYTGGHTRRVQEYALQIAQFLNLPDHEMEILRLAAILHDIGKIGIDDAILRKSGALTDEERMKMNEHPEIGGRIISHVEEMREVLPGVRHHHEWFNGDGYPDGLQSETIPLHARIIAIADAFDALTTDRPYRKGLSGKEAFELLCRDSGSHFDPHILEIFYKVIMTDSVKYT